MEGLKKGVLVFESSCRSAGNEAATYSVFGGLVSKDLVNVRGRKGHCLLFPQKVG